MQIAGDGKRLDLQGEFLANWRAKVFTPLMLWKGNPAQAAKDIAAEIGLSHRPVTDGQRAAGIYRRNIMLASGLYAMLDDGMEFSLVPWKPVIEQRLGQQLAATVRGGSVSWEIGRQRGPSIS